MKMKNTSVKSLQLLKKRNSISKKDSNTFARLMEQECFESGNEIKNVAGSVVVPRVRFELTTIRSSASSL
jgi:hypothetical protein